MAAKEEPNMPYEDLAPSYADEAEPEDDGSDPYGRDGGYWQHDDGRVEP